MHVITSMETGGAEHLMVDLLPQLRRLGCDVELALFDGHDTPFKREVVAAGIAVRCLGTGTATYNPVSAWRLARLMRHGHYDVVHTHNTACQLFAPVARMLSGSCVRLVTTEHNATNRRRSIRVLRPMDRLMYAQYDSIVCISDQTQANLVQYIGPRPSINTIYNGVDTSRFLCPIKSVDPDGPHLVTMIAAFRPQKDQDTLVRAIAQLPERYRLRLVGNGTRRAEVAALAERLGVADRVEMTGVCTDVPRLLRESDVVALSSHWEGLSLSSIEGMASGRPFVASDVDGLREIVEGHGVLVAEGNADGFAQAIRGLCSDPARYRAVAEACQRKARQYDITVMARNYLALYKKLLEKS